MKEFSIEEKAKAYDEALERAREYWETDNDNTLDIKAKGTMEYLFPELAESEDERIRKWLIGYFHQYKEDGMEKYANGLKVESIIAWLEKQGDSPIKWNKNTKECKPYLRPLSSMTEDEARKIATLHGLKNILSVKITDEYIDVVIDDGFSSTERITLWYDDIISSIEIFDWLNAHYFDYRGLIEKGLALEAPEGMYN